MCECVVSLYAETLEIFHYVDFNAGVRGVTQVHRLVVSVLTLVDKAVFNGVVEMLVEEAHHYLLATFREELIAEVDIVGNGVFQVGIALFLIIFIDYRIGHDFKKARTVHGAVVTEMQAALGVDFILEMGRGQNVRVTLLAIGVGVAGENQRVSLHRVLRAQPYCGVPTLALRFRHGVSRANLLRSVVVERVADIAVRAGLEFQFVEVVPILAAILRIGGTGSTVESIFVEKAAALLVAIHAAHAVSHQPVAVSQIEMSGEVAVVVVLPTARGRTRIGDMRADEI